MADDYAPVISPDEEQEDNRQRAGMYPPVMPPSAPPLTADVNSPAAGLGVSSAPQVGSTADLEAKAAQPHAYAPVEPRQETPRPQWKDYAPPDPHGWAKFGHMLAAFTPLNNMVNVAPEQRAETAFKNDTAT